MKCNATVAVVGKIMAYETCGIPKILIWIRHWKVSTIRDSLLSICIFGFKGTSTSQVIGARNKMMMDDYDGQMIFGDLVGLKLPDIHLTGEEKPQKNLTQETCPDWGSNPGPLHVISSWALFLELCLCMLLYCLCVLITAK